MTSRNWADLAAVILLFFVLAELVFLPRLLPADAAVYLAMQELRSCSLERFVSSLRHVPTWVWILAVSVPMGGFAVFTRRWGDFFRSALALSFGALFCEWLKILFERPRPNILPPAVTGDSFPSGHVMNSMIAAGVLFYLCLRGTKNTVVRGLSFLLLMAFVVLISFTRLYSRNHWLTDVVGSYLIAGAWLIFSLGHFSKPFTLRVMVISALLLFVPLVPQARIRLPSLTSRVDCPLMAVDFRDARSRPYLAGEWQGENEGQTGGVLGDVHVKIPLTERRGYLLRIGMRYVTPSGDFSCRSVDVVFNDHLVKPISLSGGWREYWVPIPKEYVRLGTNDVGFRFGDPQNRGVVAVFRYLNVF